MRKENAGQGSKFNKKLMDVAKKLGFGRKKQNLFCELMARFAELEMPFWNAVNISLHLIVMEGTHVHQKINEESEKKS